MNETELVPADLQTQVSKAKGDRAILNSLIVDYIPFIKKTVSGVFFRQQEREESMTNGMLGFLQSIKTYTPEKGTFISYCKTVIRNRLLNTAYKETRLAKKRQPLNDEFDELAITEVEQRNYEITEERKSIRAEISVINSEFSAWGFDITNLTKQKPKQARSREACQKIVVSIMAHSDLLQEVKQRRQLPVKWLINASGFSENVIYKYLSYIAALLIIETGDYPYIRSFLPHFSLQTEVLSCTV
jgi:RNA polymerase sigma factor